MTRAAHPWEASYPAGCRWDTSVETCTLPAFLDRVAARWKGRPALEYQGWTLSYEDLARWANALAAGLVVRGIGPGSTVALYMPNSPWHPITFFALARAGARIVHLSALDARREIAHKMHDSGATWVITTDLPSLVENAKWIVEEGLAARVYVAPDAFWQYESATVPSGLRNVLGLMDVKRPIRWPEVCAEDVALLQYTGGTTGQPKGAMLTHSNLTAAVSSYTSWMDERTRLEPGEQRVMLVLPLFHIYALTAVLLRHLAEGNLLLVRPRFDPAAVVDDIERHRVTVFPGVPTMFIGLLNLPEVEARDFSSLRSVSSGGAPLPAEVKARVERLLGRFLGGGWGMTETSPAGTRVTPDAPKRAGMIGLPLPGVEMRIVAAEDPSRALPPGEVGEIAVRGPNVFGGYWNAPETNAAAFRDGFFLTGDVGWMDEGGFFTLVDRRKNMIISGGFNVYPNAVEGAIYEHPDVAECIVIGVPDPYRGEAAKAYVTLRAGAPPLTLEGLREFLRDRLGRHEIPAALEVRASLPRSATGKLLASALRDEVRGMAGG